jgi:vacuolar iron transporter family protein
MQENKKYSLLKSHEKKAITRRLKAQKEPSFLGDAVLGGIDGCVTTFAVAAGAAGAGLPAFIVVIMGFANLFADGFSMAASNFMRAKSERDKVNQTMLIEETHIKLIPEGEREELRQIFEMKGFHDEVLEKIVNTISSDKKLWINTMISEEYSLAIGGPSPVKEAVVTFISFLVVGFIPVIPFLFGALPLSLQFKLSMMITTITFFLIGLIRGFVLQYKVLQSGVLTLFTGGGAALLAFLIGLFLGSLNHN